MKQLYFICAAIIILGSPYNSAKESMQSSTPLYNTKWLLKKIYDRGKEEAVNTKSFIRFDKEKGGAGGNGSCNSFGSSTTINANEISFKNIFSTKMYCEAVQQIETSFFSRLENANRFVIEHNILSLYHDKELLLEFSAE